jgi:hypothetical protein
LRHAAETLGVDPESIYERVGWPFYCKYSHALEAFKLALTDPNGVLDGLTYQEKEIGPGGHEVSPLPLPKITKAACAGASACASPLCPHATLLIRRGGRGRHAPWPHDALNSGLRSSAYSA